LQAIAMMGILARPILAPAENVTILISQMEVFAMTANGVPRLTNVRTDLVRGLCVTVQVLQILATRHSATNRLMLASKFQRQMEQPAMTCFIAMGMSHVRVAFVCLGH